MAKISITDKITQQLAPVTRKLKDLNIEMLGTETDLLRISLSTPDLFGETHETLQTQLVNNCIIKHPWANSIQLFGSIDNSGNTIASAIDLWEVLPIEIRFPFSGDSSTQALDLKQGDILVEVLRDEHNFKIPIIMTVTRLYGGFSNKYIVSKYCEATLFRGDLPTSIQTAINDYVSGLE